MQEFWQTAESSCMAHALIRFVPQPELAVSRHPLLRQVFVLAYVTAFLETFSISAFPYYTFDDRQQMYTVGCWPQI